MPMSEGHSFNADWEAHRAALNYLDLASHWLSRNWTEENFALWLRASENYNKVFRMHNPSLFDSQAR